MGTTTLIRGMGGRPPYRLSELIARFRRLRWRGGMRFASRVLRLGDGTGGGCGFAF
jgi:hypothetical protein